MNTALVELSCSWTHWIHFGPIDAPAAPPGSIRTTPNSFTRPCASSRVLAGPPEHRGGGVAVRHRPPGLPHLPGHRGRGGWTAAPARRSHRRRPSPIACRPATIRLVLLDFSTFQVPIRTVSCAPTAPAGNGTRGVGARGGGARRWSRSWLFCCLPRRQHEHPGHQPRPDARTSSQSASTEPRHGQHAQRSLPGAGSAAVLVDAASVTPTSSRAALPRRAGTDHRLRPDGSVHSAACRGMLCLMTRQLVVTDVRQNCNAAVARMRAVRAAAATCRGRGRVLPGRGSGRGWPAGG